MSKNKTLIGFLAISSAIGFQTYIDIYLPALPVIAKYFQCSASYVQVSLSIYFLGAGVSFIPYGILGDIFGRKKFLVFGLGCTFVGTVLSIFSPHISFFLIGRFFQGLGVAFYVLCSPILLDIYEGEKLISAFTYFNIAYSTIPLAAPYIGGILVNYFSWQAIFIFLAVYTGIFFILILFFMPETLENTKKSRKISFKKIDKVIINILLNKQFFFLIILAALSWSSIIAFYTVGPFLFQKIFAISPYYYGVIALFIGGSYLISTCINRILLKKFCPIVLIKTSIFLSTIISTIFVVVSSIGYSNLIIAIFFSILVVISIGLLFINGMTMSLSLFHETAGIASALQATIWVIIWAVASWVISFFQYTQFTLALSFLIFAVVNLFILIFVHKELIIPEKMK
ncbi:MAG: multidrug effflux MFS transporter [bacterium]|nr:multidrug effflux MFS transporter [bacterium]